MIRFSKRAAACAAVSMLALSLGACSKVTPGHVGVRVNNLGSIAGVEARALGIGWYFTGFGQHIYEYPVFTSTYTWTRSPTEQSPTTRSSTSRTRTACPWPRTWR